MNPDPGGPKTCGSGGSGFGSRTLVKRCSISWVSLYKRLKHFKWAVQSFLKTEIWPWAYSLCCNRRERSSDPCGKNRWKEGCRAGRWCTNKCSANLSCIGKRGGGGEKNEMQTWRRGVWANWCPQPITLMDQLVEASANVLHGFQANNQRKLGQLPKPEKFRPVAKTRENPDSFQTRANPASC